MILERSGTLPPEGGAGRVSRAASPDLILIAWKGRAVRIDRDPLTLRRSASSLALAIPSSLLALFR